MKQVLLKTWLMLVCLIVIGGSRAWAEDYELTTTITDGEYVIGALAGTAGTDNKIYAFNTTDNSSWGPATEITPSNGKISNPASSVVWTLTTSGTNGFTLKNGNNYYYIGTGTGSGSVRVKTTSTTLYYVAAASGTNAFEVSGVSSFTLSSGNQLGYNIGSGYRQYAQRTHGTGTTSGSISTQIRFYKKTGGSGDDGFSSGTVTIDASKISGFSGSYSDRTWTDGTVTGKCYAYRAGSKSPYLMQFNDNPYVYNTSAVPGRIKSIKITKGGGTDRTWSVYGRTSAYNSSTDGTKYGTQIGTAQTVSTSTTWNVPSDQDYTYFYIRKGSGSTQISSIEIEYEVSNKESGNITGSDFTLNSTGDGNTKDLSTVFADAASTGRTMAYSIERGSDVVSLTGSTLTALKAGTATVKATQTEDATYKVTTKTVTVSVNRVAGNLVIPNYTSMVVDGTQTITPSTALGDGNISYTITSGADVISITNGVITALKGGNAVVKATKAQDDIYNEASTTFNVSVAKLTPSFSIADQTLYVDEMPTVSFLTNSDSRSVSFVSENNAIAEAEDDNGDNTTFSLLGYAEGETNITATLDATDRYAQAQCTFRVTVNATPVDKIDAVIAIENNYDVELESTNVQITATSTSGGAVKFIIADADQEYLEIGDDGTIYATKAGTYTVTAFSEETNVYNRAEKSFTITVYKKSATITFTSATINVEVGKNITLEPTTTPAEAEVTYTIVSGSENITIDGAVVTGVAEGSATIRADYAGNGEYNAASTTVTINVIPADESIIVTQTGFSATSGNLVDDTNGEDANLSYEAFKGNAGTAPAINSNNLRLYQNGGYVTIKGAAGVSISQVKITTGSTYESTTVGYCVDDEDAPETGETVAKNSDYTITDLDNQSVSIYCLGTDKNTRLDIAAIEVKYTKEDIVLSSIALSGKYKTEFIQNQTFNHDGIVVTASFSNGQNEDVTAKAEFTDPDMTTTGTKTITVSYTDADVTKTAQYDITVTEEVVTAIALSGEYQTTFRVGDEFNHDNLEVKATYNSGRTGIDVTSKATVSTPDMSVAGEQTITVSYGGQTANYTIKVLSANTIFYESFDTNDGTGGNDGQWSGSIAANNISSDNEGWTYAYSGGANKCAKFGTGSAKGAATTPALGYEGAAVMTFKSAAWNGGSESLVVNLSVEGDGAISQSSITNKKGEWTEYTVTLTGLTAESKVKFEAANSSNNRFFLDEVLITEPNELNLVANDGEGNYYATFSSTKDVKFVGAEVYTITVADDKLTLNEVTGKQVPAGNGVLIKSATTKVPYINVNDAEALGDNMLVACPTTGACPTVEGTNYYYKLAYGDNTNKTKLGFWWGAVDGSGNFNVKAGGAVLVVPQSAGVRGFSFTPDGALTGMNSVNGDNSQNSIYSLQGQRMLKLQRGVNIVNGRKIIR